MPLESEDQRRVTAAQGYVELGLPLEADAELDLVDAGRLSFTSGRGESPAATTNIRAKTALVRRLVPRFPSAT